jgi:hypothetical protein
MEPTACTGVLVVCILQLLNNIHSTNTVDHSLFCVWNTVRASRYHGSTFLVRCTRFLCRYAAITTPALFLSLLFLLLAMPLLLGLWLSLGSSTLCRLLLGSFRALKVTKQVKNKQVVSETVSAVESWHDTLRARY